MRAWAIAACVTLGFVGASSAHPLDSPGTVYIDGVPCNLVCQSYMDWSRKTLKATQGSVAGAPKKASAGKAAERASRERMSKRVTPNPIGATSQKKTGGIETVLTTAPKSPPLPRPRTENVLVNAETREPARERTAREQIMAALAVAELITHAGVPKPTGNDGADGSGAASASDANAAPPRGEALVALLITRPDAKSASALNGLTVALGAAQSDVEADIRSALAAAGAAETQFSVSDASPLDRLVSGEVPAAVLNLVSPDAAEAFPEIRGFKVLRVPLSTSQKKIVGVETALTAAPETPPLARPRTENVPVKAETREPARERTAREQITAALAVAELITHAEVPKPTANDGADASGAASASDANAAPGALVALLIARADVKSASALNGSTIAIDAAQSGVEQDIRSALLAAGAPEIQLSVGDANPLDRLVSGEVPAAVLNLVSASAAEAFPDIKGFKVLRVPLSPR